MSRRARAVSPRPNPFADLDPERRNAVFLVGGIGAVVLFALALIGYGYYNDRIAPRHATILTVGDTKFDYSFLERRAGAELALGNIAMTDGNAITRGIIETFAKVSREEVLRQAAAQEGMTVTQEELDAKMRDNLGLTAEATTAQFAPRLRSELISLGLPLDEYEDMTRAQIIEEKYSERFRTQVPAQSDHVDLRLIQVADKMTADSLKGQINNENFATLAAQNSIHPSRRQAGELGFVPQGSQLPEVEAAAWGKPGISEVIETDQGFFIVENRAQEVRDIDNTNKQAIVDQSVNNLVETKREEFGTDPRLTAGQLQRLQFFVFQRGS